MSREWKFEVKNHWPGSYINTCKFLEGERAEEQAGRSTWQFIGLWGGLDAYLAPSLPQEWKKCKSRQVSLLGTSRSVNETSESSVAIALLQDVLVLNAVEPRCRAQLYPDPTPGWQVDANQLFGFPWKKTQSAARKESWACSAQVCNKAPACIQVSNSQCFEGLKYYEKFQCKHLIELKLPAPTFRWPQGIRSKAPFCQPLVLLFFQSLFSDSTIALFTQEPWMLFLPWEISVLPGYQHKYKYCYSSSVVDFFQQTTAMTTNLEQLLTETSCLLNSLLMLQKALVFSVGLFTCIWKRQQGVTEVWKLYQYHAGPENGWLFKQ